MLLRATPHARRRYAPCFGAPKRSRSNLRRRPCKRACGYGWAWLSKGECNEKKRKQQRLKILLDILLFLPFFLSFSLLLVYGFTERLNLWLIALSSFSWFLLTAVYVYILITNKKIIIKQDAFYKGKPITQNEATFFAYIFAVIFLALGTMLAIMLFRELCG